MSISNRLCFSECSVEEIVPNDPDADCDREDLDDEDNDDVNDNDDDNELDDGDDGDEEERQEEIKLKKPTPGLFSFQFSDFYHCLLQLSFENSSRQIMCLIIHHHIPHPQFFLNPINDIGTAFLQNYLIVH